MKKSTITVHLPLFMWKEGAQYVIETPALNLSTFGDTEKEAKENFNEAVELFFEVADERRTLEDMLLQLGWEKVETAQQWIPSAAPIENAHSFPVDIPVWQQN